MQEIKYSLSFCNSTKIPFQYPILPNWWALNHTCQFRILPLLPLDSACVYFARAAITKHHRLGGVTNRNVFSHSSRGWKSKIKVSVGLVSSEVSLLDVQMSTYSLCPHMVFPLCMRIPGVSLCVRISSSYKDTTDQIGSGPMLTVLF